MARAMRVSFTRTLFEQTYRPKTEILEIADTLGDNACGPGTDSEFPANCAGNSCQSPDRRKFMSVPGSPEQVRNNVENRIPLHREGKPEEVAEAIVALVENDFITGADLPI